MTSPSVKAWRLSQNDSVQCPGSQDATRHLGGGSFQSALSWTRRGSSDQAMQFEGIPWPHRQYQHQTETHADTPHTWKEKGDTLTHCHKASFNVSEQWIRWWLVAWWHQAITLSEVNLSLPRSSGTHPKGSHNCLINWELYLKQGATEPRYLADEILLFFQPEVKHTPNTVAETWEQLYQKGSWTL